MSGPESDVVRCRHCHREIRRSVRESAQFGWYHHWSFAVGCGLGRSTDADPEPDQEADEL